MKDDDVMKMIWGCGSLVLIILLACGIAIGIAADSFWVGLGVAFFLWISVAAAYYYVMNDDLKTYLWTLGCFAGLLVMFANYGGFGRGWWITGWLLVAFAHMIVGIYAHEQKRPFHRFVAGSLAALSIITVMVQPATIAAFLGPLARATPIESPSIVWMWILLIVGFVFLFAGWSQGYTHTEGKPFIALTLIGVGLLAGATWLSGLRGGWWWAVPWGLAALMIGHAARELREYYKPQAANFGVLLVLLCLAIGIGGPYLAGRGWTIGAMPTVTEPAATSTAVPTSTQAVPSPPPLATPATQVQTPTPEPAARRLDFDIDAAHKAASGLLQAAFKSVWGILHLIMLWLLGYLWFRNGWGAVLLPFALLVAVWIAGGLHSPTQSIFVHAFSSSPAGWMRDMLLFSVDRWGTMGCGILLTAGGVVVVILPALRINSKVNHALALNRTSRPWDSFVMRKVMQDMDRLGVRPRDNVLATLAIALIPTGLFIALWIGLRQIAAMGGLPMDFAGIPDLTVPHWKPVWSLPYFLLAFLLLLALNLLLGMQKKLEPIQQAYPGCFSNAVLLPAVAVAAGLCPAGAMLFSLGVALMQTVLYPLRVWGVSSEAAGKLQPEPEPPIVIEQPPPIEPKPPTSKGTSVWSSPRPLVAMLALADSEWFLTDGRVLFIRIRAKDIEQINLPIQTATALFALKEASLDKEGQVLVIGDKRQLLRIGQDSHDTLQTLTLSQSADAFALNPYKTMLAWINASDGTVGGLYLESGKEMTFLSDMSLERALAFSDDGRYLALGDSEGTIHLLDVATRKVAATLTLPEVSSSVKKAVRALFGCQDGGWVCVYQDRRIVRWTADCQVGKERGPIRRKINALDYHPQTERLALGLSDGILQVFDADLKKTLEETVQDKEISAVSFSQDGRWVFTIGGKTEVKKVSL